MIDYAESSQGGAGAWTSGPPRSPATVRRVLDGFERYGRILASQLEAISDVPDLERFNRLAQEGDKLARELDSLAAGAAGAAAARTAASASEPRPRSDAAFQDSLRQRIEECLVTDRHIRERLRALRDHAAVALSTFDERRPALDRYAEEPTPRLRVDLRS